MLTGKTSAGDMEAYNNNAMKEYNDKALDACPNCARTFLPDRLIVHLRSCNKANGKADASPEVKSKSMGGSLGGGGIDKRGGSP
jgi:zinc-finger of a C2HC-type